MRLFSTNHPLLLIASIRLSIIQDLHKVSNKRKGTNMEPAQKTTTHLVALVR